MIGLFLIVQISDASDKRRVAVTFGPINCFSLRFEGAEDVIGMIFDDIIVDVAAFRTALRARFNVNVCHFRSFILGSRREFQHCPINAMESTGGFSERRQKCRVQGLGSRWLLLRSYLRIDNPKSMTLQSLQFFFRLDHLSLS
jgi:hypothetical protein